MRILFAIVSMVGLVLGMSVILAQEKKEQNVPEQNGSDQTLSALIKLNKKTRIINLRIRVSYLYVLVSYK